MSSIAYIVDRLEGLHQRALAAYSPIRPFSDATPVLMQSEEIRVLGLAIEELRGYLTTKEKGHEGEAMTAGVTLDVCSACGYPWDEHGSWTLDCPTTTDAGLNV